MDHAMPDKSGATVLDDLPESIIVWEILIRLPPKDALRCRAVRKSWRRATCTRDFLVAHHRHQPCLPLIKQSTDNITHSPVIAASDDPRLLVFPGAGDQKLRPVPRYATDPSRFQLHACRDGLLVVSNTASGISFCDRKRVFYLCNPATRQCAPLPQLTEHGRQVYTTSISGLYLHHPSGEYRALYLCWAGPRKRNADFYITSIGLDETRKFIGRPPPSSPPSVEQALLRGLPYSSKIAPILHRGGLHWDLGREDQYYSGMSDIMVFDTAVETFRWLRRPAQAPLGRLTLLLELDGALALFSASHRAAMDVFVMRDYDHQVWALPYRIDLSAATPELPPSELTMVVLSERELLIQLPGRVLHCDIGGKVLGIVDWHGEEDEPRPVQVTTHLLQESIVPLPYFETQKGTGTSNDPPFFLGL